MIGVKIMIDFHSHILPGIDDGSQTVNETVEMLRMEKQQGCVKVIATPHFYADYDSAGRFLDKRAEALHKVQALREQEDWMPEIQAGAEVYFFSGIGRADILPRLCVEGTSLLLLEMPFAQWTRDMAREVQDIIKKQGLDVILAHVERFYEFQKDKKVWNEILEMPLTLQINAGAMRDRKKRNCIFRLLKEGYPVIMGSDCHNTSTRPPNLETGRETLQKKFWDSVLEKIDGLGEQVLRIHEKR